MKCAAASSLDGGGLFNAVKVVAGELLGAELLDTFLLRPIVLYLCSVIFGVMVGTIVGGFVADAGFWLIVFATKRLRR